MKICFFFGTHPKYDIGGAETQMLLMAKKLQEKGADFQYITRRISKDQKRNEIINGIKTRSIGIKDIKSGHSISEKLFNLIDSSNLIFFKIILQAFDFDIFHLRSATLLTGIFPFLIKKIKKKIFIFTVPSIIFCDDKNLPWCFLYRKIYKYNIKRADVVICLTEYIKEALYQNYGIKSLVIKSGHPIPQKPFKKNILPTILWISSLIDIKRPELFLEIAKELKDLDANFLLIGPREYKKKEIMGFDENNKNFTFIPGVPYGEDNSYYERASLLVNTSIYEGFPNTFIQAWLHETPVISLNVDPDYVICKYGLGFHAKGNLNDLINQIRELIGHPLKLKKMGEKCRKYAIENHDIKQTAEQHYRLYKLLLEK